MKASLEYKESPSGWIKGVLGELRFEVKVYGMPQPTGLNGGRITKLCVRRPDGALVMHYGPEWTKPPSDEDLGVLRRLLEEFT